MRFSRVKAEYYSDWSLETRAGFVFRITHWFGDALYHGWHFEWWQHQARRAREPGRP